MSCLYGFNVLCGPFCRLGTEFIVPHLLYLNHPLMYVLAPALLDLVCRTTEAGMLPSTPSETPGPSDSCDSRQVRRYWNSRITGLNSDAVVERIHDLMVHDHAYKDEELSLKSLSQMLGGTLEQLSEVINSRFNQNLNAHITRFRVGAARKILRAKPNEAFWKSPWHAASARYEPSIRPSRAVSE